MTKYFCDICEKELPPTGESVVSYILILERNTCSPWSTEKEICDECAKKILNMFED